MTESPPPPERSAAAKYWAGNLDPHNLERNAEKSSRLSVAAEIDFARTPDLLAAADWLRGAAAGWIIDLGAGLGANTFALARERLPILAVDTSLARMRELRRRAREAGEPLPFAIVCAAEALPFRDNGLAGVYTKSVLIHTDLPRAADEIHRALAPGGRAALAEPQPGNPFAWAYRRWFGPKIWGSITRYFDPAAQAIFQSPFGGHGGIKPFYFFSFLAFAFQFALPSRPLFRLALVPLHLFDSILFRLIPPFRRLAWFGLIRLEKR